MNSKNEDTRVLMSIDNRHINYIITELREEHSTCKKYTIFNGVYYL